VASIDGLYLSFAVICEKVLREADDVLSFIRVVDQLTITIMVPPGIDAPPELPAAPPVSLTFVLGLKSAGYAGPVPVKLWVETPAGMKLPEYETAQQIGGVDRGLNLIFPMQFPAQDEGIYWFVVEVSGEVVTRVPLRISKQVGPQTVPMQD
jgi:hypothetical protein